jgi:hypothetical protein
MAIITAIISSQLQPTPADEGLLARTTVGRFGCSGLLEPISATRSEGLECDASPRGFKSHSLRQSFGCGLAGPAALITAKNFTTPRVL